jgi:hypothetical protein
LDTTKKGFFEDNGRVKMIKLRGEYSDGFLFPFEYLQWAALVTELPIGTEFDTINGHKICEKYIPPEARKSGSKNRRQSIKKREVPMFKEHFDTDQFMRSKHKIPAGTVCYIEEKVHGTSHRIGYVQIDAYEDLPWYKKLFAKKPQLKWTYLNGTRRTIQLPGKDINPYHDNTMREEALEKARGLLMKGEELYLELFGFEKGGQHIQKGFPYGCDLREYRAILYRVTLNNPDGHVVDYTREAVYSRAKELGFEPPHLFEKFYYNGSEESMAILEGRMIELAQGRSKMGKGAHDTMQDGVVCWFVDEAGKWTALKYKSDAFRLKESNLKDQGVIDQEDIN